MKHKKLFGTDGIRGKANSHPITPEMMLKLGKAVALVCKNKKTRHKILIGKDTRISGYILETALTSGICSMGVDVMLVGPLPTPAIAHLTKSFNADAGIVISASHNPSEDNGIKFFSREGIKLSDATEHEIEKNVFSETIEAKHITGTRIGKAYRIDDARGRYIEFAKSTINNSSLKGLKIILDCANGAAYGVAPTIFQELGAEVIPLNVTPNGININQNSGALHPKVISKATLTHKADIGIALDGDADRVIMVDEKGKVMNGDHIMAIIAIDLLKKNKLNRKTLVVTDYSNLAVDKLLKKHGANVVRVQNGDRYVMAEMLKKGCNFGGERSGHIILGNHNTTGDGIITALYLLAIMKQKKKKLSALKGLLKEFPQTLLNIDIRKKKPFENMPRTRKTIKDAEQKLGSNGRLLIRYSGTEKIARIMIEGKDKNRIKKMAQKIARQVKKEIGR